jgi:hypothetical protein
MAEAKLERPTPSKVAIEFDQNETGEKSNEATCHMHSAIAPHWTNGLTSEGGKSRFNQNCDSVLQPKIRGSSRFKAPLRHAASWLRSGISLAPNVVSRVSIQHHSMRGCIYRSWAQTFNPCVANPDNLMTHLVTVFHTSYAVSARRGFPPGYLCGQSF